MLMFHNVWRCRVLVAQTHGDVVGAKIKWDSLGTIAQLKLHYNPQEVSHCSVCSWQINTITCLFDFTVLSPGLFSVDLAPFAPNSVVSVSALHID